MTTLECLSCDHKFPSNEVEFINIDISNKYFRIDGNCPKCNTEGLTTFINNKNEDMRWLLQYFVQSVVRLKNQEKNSQTKMVAQYAKNAGLMKRIIIKKITRNYNNFIW